MQSPAPANLDTVYEQEVVGRLVQVSATARTGGLNAAIDLLATAIARGGVIHAFGTGHSEAFAMEIAGRAGGLIPTNRIALRDAVLFGDHGVEELGGRPPLERDPRIAEDLFATVTRKEHDVFVMLDPEAAAGLTSAAGCEAALTDTRQALR